MYRTSRAFLNVATILGTVCGAIILACVPVLLVLGVSPTILDMLKEALANGTVKNESDLTPDQAILLFQAIMIFTAVMLIIIGGLCVADAIVASQTKKEPTRGRYIACIVLGAMTVQFSVAAGILGLIYLSKQERRKAKELE